MFDIFNMLKKDEAKEACEVHGVDCDELLEKLNAHLASKKS